MRDLLLLFFVVGCLGISFRFPFAGLILWAWFTIVTPHQLAFGTFGIPLNLLIAAVTFAAVFVTREVVRFRWDPITVLLVLMLIWQTIAQYMSVQPDGSSEYFSRFMKTLIFVLLCAQLATSKLRFHALIWILVGGIGFFAIKGALFTILTLGQNRVHGLENTILEDNNHFGIAAASLLPLMVYLRSQLDNPILKHMMIGMILLTLAAVLGTHSRGALVTLVAFGGYLWLQSRHKLTLGLIGAAAMIPLLMFMPQKWFDRMQTIAEAGADESFMGRVAAWEINFRLAVDNPVTGVGLRNSYSEEVAKLSAPEIAEKARAAHSIYFELLGGSGFVGLAVFLALIGGAVLVARRIEFSKAQNVPDWHREFARYSQMSLFIFCIGGASTSMEMWDGYLLIIALLGALSKMHAAKATNMVAGSTLNWRPNVRVFRNSPRQKEAREALLSALMENADHGSKADSLASDTITRRRYRWKSAT